MARPDARGWKPIAALAPDVPRTRDVGRNLRAWLLGCVMVYAAMFAVGEFCLERWLAGAALTVTAAICGAAIYHLYLSRSAWREA
jgi:hypothetical protein